MYEERGDMQLEGFPRAVEAGFGGFVGVVVRSLERTWRFTDTGNREVRRRISTLIPLLGGSCSGTYGTTR